MAVHKLENIRNVAFVGHAAAGKTTLGEALLHKAGVTNRQGSVDDGTSNLDYDDESRERRHSVDSSLLFFEHGGTLINAIDTPGMPDYAGPAIAALAGVETAIVVVSAASGIGVNTRRMFNAAKDYGLARMIVINRIDAENADLEAVVAAVRASFGSECHPINLPADGGKRVIDVLAKDDGAADILDVHQCHTELLDSIVETDDSLMEEYMSSGAVPQDKLGPAIEQAVASGHVVPILFTDARHDVGIAELMEAIKLFAPDPHYGKHRVLVAGNGPETRETPLEPKLDGDFIAQVFKITSDPKSNIKYSVARVHCGTIRNDAAMVIGDDRKGARIGHIFKLRGNDHVEIPEAAAGDIVAFAKLDLHIGSMLSSRPIEGQIPLPRFPTPMYALAVEAKTRADGDKVSTALHRYAEEDPCFKFHRDAQTGELVIEGLGDLHLTVLRSKMKRQYKLEVESHPPKIPYRETIAGSAKYVEYTHKKQTGGAGQFARVFIDIEPNERGKGYEFIDKIFGGVIDQPFRPSVDKGIREVLKQGVVAGCPVVDVKVSLVDG
jgi:elongation factor G